MESAIVSAVVWGFRGLLFMIRRRVQGPAKRLSWDIALKAEMDARLPPSDPGNPPEYRGEIIVRDLRRRDSYPDLDDRIVGRASPWYKAEVKGLYDEGLEVYARGSHVLITDGVARDAESSDPGTEAAVLIGRIPFGRIAGIDWIGDPEDPGKPHVYCWFDRRFGWRSHYETVLYRKGYGGHLIRIPDVRYRPTRLPRRERRRINQEYQRRVKDAQEKLPPDR